ncbi:aminotransferase A [Niallia sp. Krafla_26]|uniref:aminotransferase A n=1 Tax=Niallia sp. Krafla_26 TaxID=3064703 RepID=UPI003D173651
MEHLVNKRVREIEISGIRKFSNMVSETEGMISLTIGQPDFPTPEHVKEAGKRAIDANMTSYTHNAGDIKLRQAASQYVKEKYKLNYKPETEIIVTVGASEAIDIAFRTILEEGSEVILPGPVYPGYEPLIKMCGAKPIYVDIRENDFRFTAEMIMPYINESTRCIVLPYPSNPTGISLTEAELKDIANLVEEKEVFILADEIYSELVFDRFHTSIATFIKEKTIIINGLSKSHSMTGWRIGFLFAPENIVKHILKVHQYNVSCATSISQMAAIEALTNGKNDAWKMKKEYLERRNYVYHRLTRMGLEVHKPDGAFYFFVKIPYQIPSFDFCVDLAKKEKVAVVPGSAFSNFGEGYFRLSFSCSMELLEEGLNRIHHYLKNVQV